MARRGRFTCKEIVLTAQQADAYESISKELLENYKAMAPDSGNKDILVLKPCLGRYQGITQVRKCIETGNPIKQGEEAVLILGDILDENRKISLGVVKNTRAFFRLLERGRLQT